MGGELSRPSRSPARARHGGGSQGKSTPPDPAEIVRPLRSLMFAEAGQETSFTVVARENQRFEFDVKPLEREATQLPVQRTVTFDSRMGGVRLQLRGTVLGTVRG